jgi:hypothetical protein
MEFLIDKKISNTGHTLVRDGDEMYVLSKCCDERIDVWDGKIRCDLCKEDFGNDTYINRVDLRDWVGNCHENTFSGWLQYWFELEDAKLMVE